MNRINSRIGTVRSYHPDLKPSSWHQYRIGTFDKPVLGLKVKLVMSGSAGKVTPAMEMFRNSRSLTLTERSANIVS